MLLVMDRDLVCSAVTHTDADTDTDIHGLNAETVVHGTADEYHERAGLANWPFR